MSDNPSNPFGDGMPDLGGLLESAQQMMANAQEVAARVVEGQASGGLVKIEVDGHFNFHSVSIQPSAIDPDDPQLLEDLILAALRDASVQLQAGQEGAMGGMDLGGLDLGGLGDMLDGGDQ
jgi:DNA-binding YbaB/EbfC family protein